MKCAVVTLCVGAFYEMVGKVSHPLMQQYADKIGANFICVKDFGGHAIGPYKKFDIFQDLLKEEFDRVLFVDTDILIRPDSPNIFNIVPDDALGLFNEGSVLDRSNAWAHLFHMLGYPINPFAEQDSPRYFNTGVMLASRMHRSLFAPATVEVDCYSEQSFFNFRLWDRKAKVFELPYRFNRIHALSAMTGESWDDSYFAHFAGCFGHTNSNLQGNFKEFQAMGQRFASYLVPENRPQFKQKIRIDYQGALGDIVAGEPLIRFLVEHMYPNESVTVRCTQPQVLAHLPCLVKPFSDPCPNDNGEYVITPIPKDVQNPVFHITHPLDFMSIKAFNGTLPKEHRRIKLKPADRVPWDVSQHVLIHFGKTWTSKTFPLEYCEAIVEGLLALQVPVALIGCWTVDGLSGEGTLDLRGLTTLPDLFRVIADAPVLLSNDSSPVHIAGAFDNPCVMIPTCKHPDHVWPHRNEGLNIALGNTFTLDLRPNKPRQVLRVDEATENQLWEILPEVDDVLSTVFRLWKSRRLVQAEGELYNPRQGESTA